MPFSIIELVAIVSVIGGAVAGLYKAVTMLGSSFIDQLDKVIERRLAPIESEVRDAVEEARRTALDVKRLSSGFETLASDVNRLKGWTEGYMAGARRGGNDESV